MPKPYWEPGMETAQSDVLDLRINAPCGECERGNRVLCFVEGPGAIDSVCGSIWERNKECSPVTKLAFSLSCSC